MSEIQSNNPIKMEDLIETFDSSAEGTVEAINKIHTSAETRKSAEDSMNERRLFDKCSARRWSPRRISANQKKAGQ
jgi:hypothetical protein